LKQKFSPTKTAKLFKNEKNGTNFHRVVLFYDMKNLQSYEVDRKDEVEAIKRHTDKQDYHHRQ
jgi:hypothetical protein